MKKIYKISSTAVIHELLGDEVIIAHLETGIYYSVRQSGAPLWQLLTASYSLSEIIDLFIQQYSISRDSISNTLKVFVDQLIEENLIISTESLTDLPSFSIDQITWPTSFENPLLEKYEEMSTLLMLDPIHEVDEQGWPATVQ